MKLSVSWVNNSEAGRSILLSKNSTVLENGIRTIGGDAAFVSVATKEQQKAFKVGQVIDIPDHATIVMKTFKGENGAPGRTLPAWQF